MQNEIIIGDGAFNMIPKANVKVSMKTADIPTTQES
jgi:hypothetical protein